MTKDELSMVGFEIVAYSGDARSTLLELAETIQPSLCKGRGTTKWWKDCFGRNYCLYQTFSI